MCPSRGAPLRQRQRGGPAAGASAPGLQRAGRTAGAPAQAPSWWAPQRWAPRRRRRCARQGSKHWWGHGRHRWDQGRHWRGHGVGDARGDGVGAGTRQIWGDSGQVWFFTRKTLEGHSGGKPGILEKNKAFVRKKQAFWGPTTHCLKSYKNCPPATAGLARKSTGVLSHATHMQKLHNVKGVSG